MNTLKDNSGFTLIEALIAMMVLSIGILALSTMQISSVEGNATANRLTIADTVAGDCYEHLLSLPYDHDSLDGEAKSNPHSLNELPTPRPQLPANVSSVTWTVTEWSNEDGFNNDGDGLTDEDDERGVKGITLTVNYRDKRAKRLTITFLKTELYQ
ncbi:MAG: prepilin-type N-terminal cleavage/methylation domain-containing protein [Desulfobacter sp.]|nr:MAG: prepilin-type N-terminal cleavage/methylation domain-containing protein [Desulfobacter sp.]